MLAIRGVDNVCGPRRRRGIKQARFVYLCPHRSLAVEGRRVARRFRNVDDHRSFVTTSDGIFTCSLVVLMPFKGNLRQSEKLLFKT